MQLVESLTQAETNAVEFSQLSLQFDCIPYRRFSQFFHWYYFSHMNVFAPSKFIGYADTTLANYRGIGTGTETQRALSKWFVKVPTSAANYNHLRENLEAYAKGIGKEVSRKTFEGTGGIYLLKDEFATYDFADEIDAGVDTEGGRRQVLVNAYERSPRARAKCITHWGAICFICRFDFAKFYGAEIGAGFIHVHHLVDIATIGHSYEVDAINDLRPVCPNCHAMLHKKKPAMQLDDLRQRIEAQSAIARKR